MTASVLKQDPNTKRFKRTLIHFNTDTQYAHFLGNPLYEATKRHLDTDNGQKRWKKNERKRLYLIYIYITDVQLDSILVIKFYTISNQ